MTEPPIDPYERYRPRPSREQPAPGPYRQPGYDDYQAGPSNGQAGRPRFIPSGPQFDQPPYDQQPRFAPHDGYYPATAANGACWRVARTVSANTVPASSEEEAHPTEDLDRRRCAHCLGDLPRECHDEGAPVQPSELGVVTGRAYFGFSFGSIEIIPKPRSENRGAIRGSDAPGYLGLGPVPDGPLHGRRHR